MSKKVNRAIEEFAKSLRLKYKPMLCTYVLMAEKSKKKVKNKIKSLKKSKLKKVIILLLDCKMENLINISKNFKQSFALLPLIKHQTTFFISCKMKLGCVVHKVIL